MNDAATAEPTTETKTTVTAKVAFTRPTVEATGKKGFKASIMVSSSGDDPWYEKVSTQIYRSKDSVEKAMRAIVSNAPVKHRNISVELGEGKVSYSLKSANGQTIFTHTVKADRVPLIREALARITHTTFTDGNN